MAKVELSTYLKLLFKCLILLECRLAIYNIIKTAFVIVKKGRCFINIIFYKKMIIRIIHML